MRACSVRAWCPGRSEHFPGWLRAQEIPRGELMINRGPAGGVGGGWQPVAGPLVVLPAGTEVWAKFGDGRARRGSWGGSLEPLGAGEVVMAHLKGQDQPSPKTSRPGQGSKSCRGIW